MRWLVVLAVCFALTEATPVKFNDCGSKYGMVHMIDVTPCSKDPCQLSLGSTVNFTVQFLAKAATNGVFIDLEAVVDGQYPQPAPLTDYNACDLGVKCPVKVGDKNTLGSSLYLEEDFPATDVALTLELQKDDLSDMVCAQFNVTLVDNMQGNRASDRHARKHHKGHHVVESVAREVVVEDETVMENGVVVKKETVVKEKDFVLRFRPRP